MKLLGIDTKSLSRRAQEGARALIPISQPSVMADAVPFLDPIDQICEERPPRFMRSTQYIAVSLFVTLILLASLVKVDVVVSGTGRLDTADPPIMLQPMDRAIVRELHVKAGDAVTKGQVLATLDPTFAKADLASLTGQQRTLSAQLKRLDAELSGEAFAPAEGTSEEQLQASLYVQRQSQYASQLRVFDEDIQTKQAAMRSNEDHRSSQARQLEVYKNVEGMRAELKDKQFGSKLTFLEAKAARLRIEQDVQDTQNKLIELQHDLQSKQAERQGFVDNWRHQVLDSIVSTRTDLSKINEAATKATLLNDLVVVTAPEDGIVLDVAKRSVGSVMREAEPLITIVPLHATLIAEVLISSSDVGYTKAGDEAIVKIDAFPYQRHGFLKGKLISVSEESFPAGGNGQDGIMPSANRGGGAYHRGRIALTDTHLENVPEGAQVIPGMTLTAELKVGSRTAISYLLYPITQGLTESIREP